MVVVSMSNDPGLLVSLPVTQPLACSGSIAVIAVVLIVRCGLACTDQHYSRATGTVRNHRSMCGCQRGSMDGGGGR